MPQDGGTNLTLSQDQMSAGGDDVVSPCPGPCDAVIPLVYSQQPITIPYQAVRDQLPFELDVVESFEQTFNQPNTTPPMAIVSRTASRVRVTGLGHAGVAIVNGETGEVAYYEYGRYDSAARGKVLTKSVPNLTFGSDHNPDPASFNALMSALTRTNGGPYAFEGVYVKLARGRFDGMKTFADTRAAAVDARTVPDYDVAGNHCFTFALEVATAGGISADVSSAPDLEMILEGGNWLTRGVIGWRAPEIEVPARQILVLQERYRALNVSSGGSIRGSFEFPTALNSQ